MIEQWKPVVGYEDTYEVSDLGRVRRIRAANGATVGKVLQPNLHPRGYHFVNLSKDGYAPSRTIHRVVLEAFVGPKPEGKECCHNDGDKTNNCLSNLRWDSPKSNTADKIRHGTHGRKLTEEQVQQILDLYAGGNGKSQRSLANEFGISRKTVYNIVNRLQWAHVR